MTQILTLKENVFDKALDMIAPLIFKRQEDGGYSYVSRQPVTPADIALAEDAKESCPTDSIGNDGA